MMPVMTLDCLILYVCSWRLSIPIPLRCILVNSARSDPHLLGHSIPAEKGRLGVSVLVFPSWCFQLFLGLSAVYLSIACHLRSYVHNYMYLIHTYSIIPVVSVGRCEMSSNIT